MKIMISQPMKGKTEEQIREEREELVKELESKGHEVIDTVFAKEPPKDADMGMFYLAMSINAMSKVDGVVFMKGWESSRGCVAEEYIARKYEKFCRYIYEIDTKCMNF